MGIAATPATATAATAAMPTITAIMAIAVAMVMTMTMVMSVIPMLFLPSLSPSHSVSQESNLERGRSDGGDPAEELGSDPSTLQGKVLII